MLSWLMIPHRQLQHLPLVDAVFNRKLSKGRSVVENAFAQLKHSFRELQVKSSLSVAFLPDVVTCCCLLHNLMLQRSWDEVNSALQELCRQQSATGNPRRQPREIPWDAHAVAEPMELQGIAKRRQLVQFFRLQRPHRP